MDWMYFGKMMLIIFTFFGIGFLMLNLRHLVKGEEFRGSCASSNPMFQTEEGGCSMCGAQPDEVCKNEDA